MSNSYETVGTSQVKLKVVVVGGGIAGLASAYALHLAGLEVIAVIEQGDGSPQPHGGLLSTYGMTSILERWGLGPQLRARAQECTSMLFRDGHFNHLIGAVGLGPERYESAASLILQIQHCDLHEILSDAVRSVNVPILCNTTALEVRTTSESAAVVLSNGSTLTVDFVIGADGMNSALRARVAYGTSDLQEVGSPVSAPQNVLQLGFTVPVSRFEDTWWFGMFAGSHEVPVWLNENYLMHTNVVGDGSLLSGTMTFGADPALLPEDLEWSEHTFASLGLDMEQFHPVLRDLFGHIDRVSARVVKASPLPEDLVCADSRIVLVGDAAHPVFPPRPALCLEDAETLRAIFGRLETRAQLPRYLNAYEEIRVTHRAEVVDSRSRMKLVMAGALDADDDDDDDYNYVFHSGWETEMRSLVYNPTEAVEGYWLMWGMRMGCPEKEKVVTTPREGLQIQKVMAQLPLTVE